jgi:eukaryotic-like serine/threonine-protein kinase
VALVVVSRLAEVLAYTHRASDPDGRRLSLVHRNLAPRHVLVTPHGETKLTGFGMAQARGRLMGTTFREAYSRLGALNPEEARGEPSDYRSDLFGLGTLLYRMLTGTQPFTASSFEELRSQVESGSYRSPLAARPDLDKRIVDLLTQLMQPDPRKRPPSAWSVWKLSWQLWREIGDASDEVRLRDLVVTPATATGETTTTIEESGI